MMSDGMTVGLAIGLGRRMRQDAEDHAQDLREMAAGHEADIDRFQAAIDQACIERDTFEARLIAQEHHVRVLQATVALLADALPAGHPYAGLADESDIDGRPMTRARKAVGEHVLAQVVKDDRVYHETMRRVARLVGVRSDHARAVALRGELAREGRGMTGVALLDELRGSGRTTG